MNSDHGLSFLTVLLNGGSNSPWSEFWSEFPHFMGMEVVPALSIQRNFNSVMHIFCNAACRSVTLYRVPPVMDCSASLPQLFWGAQVHF